jgi:hypothetical protein
MYIARIAIYLLLLNRHFMKKMIALVPVVAACLLMFQSCNKMDHGHGGSITTTETVNATISANTGYSYALPKIGSGSESKITVSAQHAFISVIAADNNGNAVYQYTPASGYSGTDAVVVTTTGEEEHGGCHHGNSGHHHDNDEDDKTTVTTFNLTIVSTPAVVAKPTTNSVSGQSF